MPLAREPRMVESRDGLTQLGGDPNDLGVTSPPQNFTVPSFALHRHYNPKNGEYRLVLQAVQKAAEGSNVSAYLGPGTYSTDLMVYANPAPPPSFFVQNYVAGSGNRRIHVVVSHTIANLSRQAELEHCKDIRRAYELTLSAAETAINDLAGSYGPTKSWRAGVQKLYQALSALQLPPQLEQIFRATISPDGDVDQQQFRDQLGDLYLRVAAKTQDRDSQGWHTLMPNLQKEWSGPSSWWRRSADTDYREAICGAHFQVPGPASDQVISL